MKAQIVHVKDRFQTLRNFHVHARVVNKDSGIDEVCLPFDLAAAQAGQNAVRLYQADSGLRQADAVAIPERELPADKIRIVEDRVKAICLSIRRVLIALRPEKRSAKTKVIFVDRSLDCRHVRTDVHRATSDRITIVATEGVVIRVRQVEPAEMPVTVDPYIGNLDGVRPHVANQCRPHQKPVPIEFVAAAIVVVERARLNRVALLDEVLTKDVRNVNILMTQIETIQPTVRVLLELREVRRVVLVTIVIKTAEDARAQRVGWEDE